MKITFVCWSTVFVLLVVISIGCQEEIKIYGDIDKVEITDYSITTQWYIPGYGAFQNYSKPGFYKYYPDTAYNPRYITTGTAKNIAGRNLKNVDISISYYDLNSNKIASENTTISSLTYAQSTQFTIYLYLKNQNYKNIEKIKFYISAQG